MIVFKENQPLDSAHFEWIHQQKIKRPTPSPAHQVLSMRLIQLFLKCEYRSCGALFHGPINVYLGNDILLPDLLFVTHDRSNLIQEDGIYGAPDLVIEIVSENTRARDEGIKQELYLTHGVREYWRVEAETPKLTRVWRDEQGVMQEEVFGEKDIVRSMVCPALSFEVKELYQL